MTINDKAITYLTSLASRNNHTPDKPISQFTASDAYRMIRDIHAPEITHTPGEYRTDNIHHALAYALATHDLRGDMYRAESILAHRLGDTETQTRSARNAGKEAAANGAIRYAMEIAGITSSPAGDIAAEMITARQEGESNWPYVGMTRWEEKQRTT